MVSLSDMISKLPAQAAVRYSYSHLVVIDEVSRADWIETILISEGRSVPSYPERFRNMTLARADGIIRQIVYMLSCPTDARSLSGFWAQWTWEPGGFPARTSDRMT